MIVQNTGNIRQALSSPGVHVDGETYRRTSSESQSYSSFSLFARVNINGFYKIMRYVVIIHVKFSETCISNHQPHGCLLNCLFRRRSKETSKLRLTGLCEGNSPGTGEFHAQRASNAETVFIWWRQSIKLEHIYSNTFVTVIFHWNFFSNFCFKTPNSQCSFPNWYHSIGYTSTTGWSYCKRIEPTVFQRQRLPPEVPTRVKYLSFNELSADAHKLSQPWVLLRSTDENIIVGKVDDLGDVGLIVLMDVEFNAAVYWQGILNAIDNYCAFHHPIAMCAFHHPIAIIIMNRWSHW